MTEFTAQQLLTGIQDHGVKNLVLVPGWDNKSHQGNFNYDHNYVVLHDTGTGIPTAQLPDHVSLDWIAYNNPYAPVPAANFLVGRGGTIFFTYAYGCYHAGEGGPYGPSYGTVGDVDVAQDCMNAYAFGIEHESSGLDWDLTNAQVASGAHLTAALLMLMGKTTDNLLNHKDWTDCNPRTRGRKVDTHQSRQYWVDKVLPYMVKTVINIPAIHVADVQIGKSNAEVKVLQQALAKVGYNPGTIDGIFGPKTRAAYSAWQQHCVVLGNLTNGQPGLSTLQTLANTTKLFTVS